MQEGLLIIISLIIFSGLDIVIFLNTIKNRAEVKFQHFFRLFAAFVTVQQLVSVVIYAGFYGMIKPSSALSCVVAALGIVSMSAAAYAWFECLILTLPNELDISSPSRFAHSIPVMIMMMLCAVSQKTHWLFYVDSYGSVRPGTMPGLQLICPMLYIMSAIPVVLTEKKEKDRRFISRTMRNYIIFVLPSIGGTIVQLTVFRGGYAQIGISLGLLLMYLEQYMEIVGEAERLRSIESLNAALQEKQQNLESRLNIINSMSSVYFASYYIDLKENTYIELSSSRSIRSTIGRSGNAQESLYIAAEKLVLPEYTERMKEFWDLSTINERLKRKIAVSCEYVGVTSGWSMAFLIAGDRDEDGNLLHIFYAARTIHDEKMREEEQTRKLAQAMRDAEAANAAKTAFLFNMSHDIRTPMNAIIGYIDLIDRDFDDPDKCRDYLGKIKSSSDFLLSLINNVLEMARIESGQYSLDETLEVAGDIPKGIEAVFAERMKRKGIDFACSLNHVTEYIFIDAVKVKEVCLNIVANAYKYTPSGGSIRIDITELESDREGYAVFRTRISDTGIGMSKEFLPHIYDEFSREKTVTEDRIEGTGLGMPIVKKFVELMGGTIEVESELGKGTAFTITLTHRIGSGEMLAPKKSIDVDYSIFAGKRILVTEDNDLNAEIASEILKDVGFAVERAADGAICVDMVQQAENGYYDLILMDVQMPNMDGYRATQIIRKMQDPEKNSIPIVAMTANAFDEDRRNALDAGMNAHLGKPVRTDELMSTLAEMLGGKQ